MTTKTHEVTKPTIRELLDAQKRAGLIQSADLAELLAERVEAVLRLHKPFQNKKHMPGPMLCSVCLHEGGPLSASWPCPTIRALDGEVSR